MSSNAIPNSKWATPIAIVAVALSYALLGKLALLLAIPPGYATALFPSAGLAVAAVLLWGMRLLPGVLLGSFLLNLWVSLDAGQPLLSSTTIVALAIASGALLQAALGALLVRRYVGFPTALADEKEIIAFLLLAGPVSCLSNASIGCLSLLLAGVINSNGFFYSWFNWWVGDVIGVMIMAPLMLILFAKPRRIWQQRLVTVALPLVVTCAVVVLVFIQVSLNEMERLKLQFREEAGVKVAAIKSRFELCIHELSALERFYAASNFVDRNEFRIFVSATLANNPGIQALEWLPRVSWQQRQEFEARMRKEVDTDFMITERDASQNLVQAGKRDNYFPVTYVEPFAGNEAAFGYDVGSSSKRRAALEQARDNGVMVMTAPLTLVQSDSEHKGALIFVPIYERGTLPMTPRLRQQRLKGFVLGVFEFDTLIDAALTPFTGESYHLHVTDVTDNLAPFPIYGNTETTPPSALNWSTSIRIGERTLQLTFNPTAEYLTQHRSLQSWMVLAWGLLFASLLGAFLLLISGQTHKVRQMVERQTLELRSILENVLEAIITFDSDCRIESVNPAAEQLFGYPRKALLTMHLSQLIPAAANCVMDGFLNKTCEIFAVAKDGRELPVEFGVSEVVLPERRFYTGIVRDLSEQKKIDRMKNEFISTVSHELRTPITSIRGAFGLINGGVLGEPPQKMVEMLKIAAANSDRLANLINDILDVEKLEFGEVIFNLQRHDLGGLIQKSLDQNAGYAKQFGVGLKFETDAAAQPLFVNADEQRFAQVMANLISNAIKFSPTDGEVDVKLERQGDSVEIAVIDRGPGISEEHRALIFKKFSQVDGSDSRQRGGTGLGLNIVRTIVTRMGGDVNFRPNPDGGTIFYVHLPLIQ